MECGDPSVTDGAELAGAFNKPHPQPGSDICREPASSLLAQTTGLADGLGDGLANRSPVQRQTGQRSEAGPSQTTGLNGHRPDATARAGREKVLQCHASYLH